MKYKVGDKVKLKSKEGLDELKRQVGDLHIHPDAYKNAGSEQTILECNEGFYRYDASSMFWHESLFEGLAEEGTKVGTALNPIELKSNANCLTREMIEGVMGEKIKPKIIEEAKTYWDSIKDAWICPQGYQFVDEYGNIINATKIVLEKKKKEYPNTYDKCCEVLKYSPKQGIAMMGVTEEEEELFRRLIFLKRCRDAYWKIAGEEMGLGKPWEPDWSDCEKIKYIIGGYGGEIGKGQSHNIHITLAFPTPEMRDAFKENFDPDIVFCKEFL